MLDKLLIEVENNKNLKQSKILSCFFKTGKGQYGEGDIFLGIKVPVQRKIAKKYVGLSLNDVNYLINSRIHEHRLIALLILVDKFNKSNEHQKKVIYTFYLKHTKQINNWDLVDLSSPKIVGNYLLTKNKNDLYKLSKSNNLWEKRISIISTFEFIKNKQFNDTIKISEILLNDKHDLIHKAVGWMLREMGKRDESKLICFLNKYYKKMPRTMLRYSIEKLSVQNKKHYMS